MGVRSRLPSYVRSSDMYSHTGTMPRKKDKDKVKVKDKDKEKDKDSKDKDKEKERGSKSVWKGGRAGSRSGPGLGRSQSMRPVDHVIDSPLLSALSSQRRPTLTQTQTQPQGAPEPPATGGSCAEVQEGRGGSSSNTDRPLPATPHAAPSPPTADVSSPVPVSPTTPASSPDTTLSSAQAPAPDPGDAAEAEQPVASPSKAALDESAAAGETAAPGGGSVQTQPDLSAAASVSTTALTQQRTGTLKPPCQVVLPMKRRRREEEKREEERREEEKRSSPEERRRGAEELQPAPPHSQQQEETDNSQMDPSGQQGYVQFSKEKYLLESPPEKLRKELEEELRLSSTDIRSHAWYHGHIPREVSESLVQRSGDFLVRDSLVRAGDYVLTLRWGADACVFHVCVCKVLVRGGETQVQYHLEGLEGSTFDTVPALVRFYTGQHRPVCVRTGAQISCPISRTLPLRYLEATFALANGRPGSAQSPCSPRGAYIKRRSVTMTDGLTQADKALPHSPSTIHHPKDAMRSCALSMDQIQEYRCPHTLLSPVGETPLSPAYSAVSRHRHGSGGRILAVIPPSPAVPRRSSDPHLTPDPSASPPSAQVHTHPHTEGPEASGSYCELRPQPAGPPGPCPPPSQSYVERLRVEERGGGETTGDQPVVFTLPLVENVSSLRPGVYQSGLLPVDNKPLEMAVLKRVKELMQETDAHTAAMHITKADCTVARILGVTKETQRMMGVSSGLELLTLPHGHQLRLDLLERFYTMSIMLAVDVLGCTGSTEERASLLHKTIQLAAQLKNALGNMFGFAAVMRALELPQISRLDQTWTALRQRHTEGAILYEKKLKPFLKNMNDGKGILPLPLSNVHSSTTSLSFWDRNSLVSESLVQRSGDFLVRDSLVRAGDYVLTLRWGADACVFHVCVCKVLVRGGETQVQYHLEGLEGSTFDTVPALVRFYTGQHRPVCVRTGAQISCPISRTLPLRYLEATFALANGRPGSAQSPCSPRGAYIKRRSVTMTDGLTQADKALPHSPSTIHHPKDAMRSCALSMDQIQEYRCPHTLLSPVGETPLSPAYSAVSRHRHGSGGRILAVIPPSPAVPRRSSDPHLTPDPSASPPSAHIHTHTLTEGPEASGSYCELRPQPAGPPGPCPPPSQSYVERLRVEERGGGETTGDQPVAFTLPLVENVSSLRPGVYQSGLLPVDNKPLEMAVLKRVKELMQETDAHTAAMHITKADCTVARILGVTKETQRMMGVSSGLELLTLPHGHQLRLDLLERFYTMSIMLAVDVLGCTGSTEERASLLHKTIQLAAQLKNALGNMFGFAAVMRALELPQISRLDQTWTALRQRHTEGAILYEKKLKPFLKNMNDGKESCVLSNTCFPPVVPLLSLLERGVAVGVTSGLEAGLESWESVEAGVDVVMSHLETGRTIAHHGGVYRTNAETKLTDLHESSDLCEIFSTEFQMRLLWGQRGSEGCQVERYSKFDKVLTALSHKLEPPVRHSEL
ncbi:SH2 domain-containing protein 3C [Engraulis encrasicolus]|uniref:SH2 domain-containing protein 3C n=1 Tax=Engraulis encrasicolus TaxID=184585 RepID=UPI002FD5FAE4